MSPLPCQYARRGRRDRAFHAVDLRAAGRQHLDVAAGARLHSRAAIHGDAAGIVGAGLARREQRGDGLAAAQEAAQARAGLGVVLAAAGAQLGEVDLAREHALLLGRQRVEVGARVAGIAGEAVDLRQPQQQFVFVGLERQALVGQRPRRIGDAGRVQVAAQEAGVVGALRAQAGLHGDAGARAGVARHHRPHAQHGGLVQHLDVAAGADFQRAGPGHGEAAGDDVAAGAHQRDVARLVVDEQVVGVAVAEREGARLQRSQGAAAADDVASGQHAHGARAQVPLPAGQVFRRAEAQQAAAADADQVAVHRVEARRRPGAGGGRRRRAEGEQHALAVGSIPRQRIGAPDGGVEIAVLHHADEGGAVGRGQRVQRCAAAHERRVAAVDRIARQQVQAAGGAGRQQHGVL